MAASGNTSCRRSSSIYKHANKAYLETATAMGLIAGARADRPAALCRAVAALPPRGARAMGRCVPPEKDRERIATYFDPLPFWYPPFEEARIDRERLPAARDHPAADADVPFLALAERLAAPDPRPEPAVHEPGRRRAASASPTTTGSGCRAMPAASEAQIKLMDGVNPDTVWTWNAIGKRSGAWNLAADSPEFTQRLPAEPPDHRDCCRRTAAIRYANADPITGQAAWYDLRVRVEKVAAGRSRRTAPALRDARAARRRCGRRPTSCATARFGSRRAAEGRAMTDLPRPQPGPEEARPRHRPRSLRRLPRLRHRLQGMEHRRPHGAAARFQRLWRRRLGRVVQPHPFLRGRRGRRARAPCISRNPACIARSRPASPCARPAPPTSAPRTASCWSTTSICIGCKLCSWACPYGAREFDADEGVMKKCTLCIDRIYNEQPRARGAPAGLRHGVPDQGAVLRRSRRPDFRGVGAGRGARRRAI